ncbi:MAG: HAD-IA family hydrolase [Abyssibacter sp.]|uniref:HAD family hydrolase n=1 Tax=Abyssibacter sp. TaxID=2320200 RepID=UPI0032196194
MTDTRLQPQHIQAISFDFDDTLWPIEPVIRGAETALKQWFASHAPTVLERYDDAGFHALRQRVGEANPELLHDMTALRIKMIRVLLDSVGESPDRATDAFEVFYAARNAVTCYEDVEQGLRRLAGRFRLVGLTNGNGRPAPREGLEYLEHTIYARDVGCAKPDPRIFAHTAAYLGLEPHAILHVGDHPDADVLGARAAGFQAVWLSRRQGSWPITAKAPVTVQCLNELADRLGA